MDICGVVIRGLLIPILVLPLGLEAQVDTGYIQQFRDRLTLSPYISSNSVRVEFRPYSDNRNMPPMNAAYQPNLRGGYGVGFSYRIIDFSLGVRQKLDPVTEAIYGSSSYTNLSFRLWATRNLLGEFTYQRIQGFANLNTPAYDTARYSLESPYEHRPDIWVRYIKLRGVYQFNPERYSYRSAFSFSERQKRSAYGFLLNASIYGHYARADSAFIPDPIRGGFHKYGMVNAIRSTGVSVGPGIGGILTRGRWFLSSVLFLGADIQAFRFYTPDLRSWTTEAKLSPMVDFRFSLGYNKPRFFAGYTLWSDLNVFRPSAFSIHSSFTRNVLCVGWRFDSPPILDKTYDTGVELVVPEKYRGYLY